MTAVQQGQSRATPWPRIGDVAPVARSWLKQVFRSDDLSTDAKVVCVAVASAPQGRFDNSFVWSLPTSVGLDVMRVLGALRELEAAGLIKRCCGCCCPKAQQHEPRWHIGWGSRKAKRKT